MIDPNEEVKGNDGGDNADQVKDKVQKRADGSFEGGGVHTNDDTTVR